MNYSSTQTEYRVRRIKLIKSCISLLIEMLLLPKFKLEKIPLSFFKNLKNSIVEELFSKKDFQREMSGIHIYSNDLDSTAQTYSKNQFSEKIKNDDENEKEIKAS